MHHLQAAVAAAHGVGIEPKRSRSKQSPLSGGEQFANSGSPCAGTTALTAPILGPASPLQVMATQSRSGESGLDCAEWAIVRSSFFMHLLPTGTAPRRLARGCRNLLCKGGVDRSIRDATNFKALKTKGESHENQNEHQGWSYGLRRGRLHACGLALGCRSHLHFSF
jgi:hypothetical protein